VLKDEDSQFRELLLSRRGEWEGAVRGQTLQSALDLLVRYRSLLIAENRIQNLTRILDPVDFFESNVLDVVALEASGFLGDDLHLDLGSGGGVPGLLSACIATDRRWHLSDSEGRKAEFLTRAARDLGLANVLDVGGRAEAMLSGGTRGPFVVVSRAVGPVERIFNWIRDCSTWNTLVLLKGPSWDTEWLDFQRSPRRNKLSLVGEYSYNVCEGKKSRRIVRLVRK
jgi:16S rRNA (guanine527-N7)-methyltransferase